MKHPARGLERKLGLRVAVGLGVFAFIAGLVTYTFVLRFQNLQSQSIQAQLVETVRAQAEVAVFANNEVIAQGVINGLLESPLILAVSINSVEGFRIEGGDLNLSEDLPGVTGYALLSPVDRTTKIGHLLVAVNYDTVKAQVAASTRILLIVIGSLVWLAAFLIIFFLRRIVIRPIEALAHQMFMISPGSGQRIEADPVHEDDEIGQLSRSANLLIEAHENALHELREMSTIDSLTGVSNRRHFFQRMAEELARIQRLESLILTVLMIDIDHFKCINDTWGHAAGDSALRQLGVILRRIIRKVDLVGRVGGEEFAILLVGTESTEGESFAERLRQMVADTPVLHEGRLIHMTLSIGISAVIADDTDASFAVARADRALYAAKDQGRNRVVMASTPPSQ